VFSFGEADIILDGNWLDLCKRFMSEMLSKVPTVNHGPMIMGKKTRLSTLEINRLEKSYERFLYMAAKYPAANGQVYVPPTCAVGILYYREKKACLIICQSLFCRSTLFGILICKSH
jgi:hypothetical protein